MSDNSIRFVQTFIPALFAFIAGIVGTYVVYIANKGDHETTINEICLSRAKYLLDNVDKLGEKNKEKNESIILNALARGNCDILKDLIREKIDSISDKQSDIDIHKVVKKNDITGLKTSLFLGYKMFDLPEYDKEPIVFSSRVVITLKTNMEIDKIRVDWDDGRGEETVSFHSKSTEHDLLYSFDNWYVTFDEDKRHVNGMIYYKNGVKQSFSKKITVNIN